MGNKNRERLDRELVERGIFSSRSKAKRSIMAGEVYVEGDLRDKAGHLVDKDASIEVKTKRNQYVSRGGLKLEAALEEFDIEVDGKMAVDIGASTGGFTHCLLKKGAKKVWAVDVGKGQLAWKLRKDDRVEVMENTNARYISPDTFPVEFELATVDVSFISLKHILPPLKEVMVSDARVISLVKPQFEAGPDRVRKGGIVSDPGVHREVLEDLSGFAEEKGYRLKGGTFSHLPGKESKNIEFFLLLNLQGASISLDFEKLVEEAHLRLKDR